MTSFPWVDFDTLLIYFILGLSLKDNGKTNSVAIFVRSNAILTRLVPDTILCDKVCQWPTHGKDVIFYHKQ
jgi:hypothetical protein